MIKVALIQSNGEIASIVSPATDDMYENGATYGEHTAILIPFETDDSDFLQRAYWDGEWKQRAPRPGNDYIWVNYQWVIDKSKLISNIRAKRDIKLWQSDWTQMPDAPLTEAQRAEWAAYRQALRDLPAEQSNVTSIDDIIWPDKPLT